MSVFHLDVDAFATSLERLQQPELAKRPLVIAPPKARATVLAASQDAKDLGIAKHMDLSRIRRDFPGILVRPPNFQLYNKAHGDLLAIASRYSPTIEPIRFGHVAMDMMGMGFLLGDLESAALKLCKNVEERLGLAMTVGIASNKLVSTIAAKETQKNREPLYRVPRDREADFLSPLPCRALPEWDDAKVRRLLFELNLRRIGQIQAIPRHIFGFAIGKLGLRLHRHAEGIDGSPVVPPFNTACLTQAHRFVPDTNDDGIIRATLYRLTEKLCFQLRAKCIGSGTARVLLKYSDGIIRNQLIHFPPTQQEQVVFSSMQKTYKHLCDRRQRVRQLKVQLEGLLDYGAQPSLFQPSREKQILPHLDAIRRRFGDTAIQQGKGLKAAGNKDAA